MDRSDNSTGRSESDSIDDLRTRAAQLLFIRLNGRALAENAKDGFERGGRGGLVVDMEQHDAASRTVPYDFLPLDLLARLTGGRDSRECQMAENADPHAKFVVIFAGRDSDGPQRFDSYRILRR